MTVSLQGVGRGTIAVRNFGISREFIRIKHGQLHVPSGHGAAGVI